MNNPKVIPPSIFEARRLLNQGCRAFDKHDFAEAKRCFQESKALAMWFNIENDPTANTARLYLCCVYNRLHLPCLRPSEAEKLPDYLELIEREYVAVLDSNPSEEYSRYAEHGLEQIRTDRPHIETIMQGLLEDLDTMPSRCTPTF